MNSPTSSPKIPLWLERPQGDQHPPQVKKRSNLFVEKSLSEFNVFMQDVLRAEKLANVTGFLQALDARGKLLIVVLSLLAIGFVRHISTLVVTIMIIILLAKLSFIPLKLYLKKVWFYVPLFTGVIAFPTLFNWVLPGDKLLTIWQDYTGYVYISELYITKQGLSVFTMLLLRTGCSVSIVMLLLLSTRWTSLLKAIRIVGVSQIFVMVLEMTYRYIFLLLQVVTDMFQAKKCRTVGKVSYREQRCFIGAAIATLLSKSLTLSQEVHMAMVARGYSGEPKALGDFKWGSEEWRFIGASILVIIGISGGDIYLGR